MLPSAFFAIFGPGETGRLRGTGTNADRFAGELSNAIFLIRGKRRPGNANRFENPDPLDGREYYG